MLRSKKSKAELTYVYKEEKSPNSPLGKIYFKPKFSILKKILKWKNSGLPLVTVTPGHLSLAQNLKKQNILINIAINGEYGQCYKIWLCLHSVVWTCVAITSTLTLFVTCPIRQVIVHIFKLRVNSINTAFCGILYIITRSRLYILE